MLLAPTLIADLMRSDEPLPHRFPPIYEIYGDDVVGEINGLKLHRVHRSNVVLPNGETTTWTAIHCNMDWVLMDRDPDALLEELGAEYEKTGMICISGVDFTHMSDVSDRPEALAALDANPLILMDGLI
jgi:hypothetical protein